VRVFGVIVMWLGLATRIWAVAALGGAFRTTVEVDLDQAVVTTGPYKWIRHPSYAGLLLTVAGSASRSATGCRRPRVLRSRCPRSLGASM
jgi:protein-S-isoprenylcysteine O-methyltransferase Ste14